MNQSGISSDNKEPSQPDRNDPPSSPSGLHPALPGLAQEVLDRLNTRLTQEQSNTARSPREHALDQLGTYMRQWRLEQGYTRADLASKLQMNVNQLISIENGIAQADEISTEQLLVLKELLPKDKVSTLGAAIDQYLAAL
jgi:ribosome-binding protein aMBF1 (putative translation factor)